MDRSDAESAGEKENDLEGEEDLGKYLYAVEDISSHLLGGEECLGMRAGGFR